MNLIGFQEEYYHRNPTLRPGYCYCLMYCRVSAMGMLAGVWVALCWTPSSDTLVEYAPRRLLTLSPYPLFVLLDVEDVLCELFALLVSDGEPRVFGNKSPGLAATTQVLICPFFPLDYQSSYPQPTFSSWNLPIISTCCSCHSSWFSLNFYILARRLFHLQVMACTRKSKKPLTKVKK